MRSDLTHQAHINSYSFDFKNIKEDFCIEKMVSPSTRSLTVDLLLAFSGASSSAEWHCSALGTET